MGSAFNFCGECEERSICKKVCKRLEKHLRSLGIYSSKWITPKMPSHLRKDKNIYREVNLTSLDKEGWQKLREKGYTAEELGYGN